MRVRRLAASISCGRDCSGRPSAASASAGDGVGKSGTELGPDEIGRSENVEHLSQHPALGSAHGRDRV